MRASLSHSDKSEPLQECHHLLRPQNRDTGQGYATLIVSTPTNSDSSVGSPSSNNISTTS